MLAPDIEEGRVKAMIVEASNPLLACSNPDGRLDRAFGKLAPCFWISGERVQRNGEQFERVAAIKAKAMKWRAPGQTVESVGQPFAKRKAPIAGTYEPLARVDLANLAVQHLAGVAFAHPSAAAPVLRPEMLSA